MEWKAEQRKRGEKRASERNWEKLVRKKYNDNKKGEKFLIKKSFSKKIITNFFQVSSVLPWCLRQGGSMKKSSYLFLIITYILVYYTWKKGSYYLFFYRTDKITRNFGAIGWLCYMQFISIDLFSIGIICMLLKNIDSIQAPYM